MRRLLAPLAAVVAALAVATLLAIAPAAAATSSLDAVEVTGNPGEKPTVTSDWPFKVKKSESEVRTEGTGTKAAKGDVVSVDYVVLNGRTGDELQASYDGGVPTATRLDSSTISAVRKALIGTPVGSRVVVAVAPKDGVAASGQAVGLKKKDTIVYVIDVNDVTTPLTRATGTAVDPVEGLPTVELDDDGSPKIFMPKADASGELIVQPLIKGDGPVVESGQTVEVHYTGAIWDTGKVFDSSWARDESAEFPIGVGQVIAGWDTGIVGQTVGSQVLLVVPPDQGYGESGQPAAGIKGTDTLVFVVDILGAT